MEELAPLIARLGPEVETPWERSRDLTRQWHGRVDDLRTLPLSAGTGGEAVRGTAPDLFEEVLRATGAVDSAILAFTARSRARIVTTERLGLGITIALGLLAALAAAAVAALNERARRFAVESVRRREEAEAALAEAARATEARSRLLRGITHDVKNPLGAAKGYAELLALGVKGPLTDHQAPLVAGIQRTIDNALAIISDLLDVARADGGQLTIHPASTRLADVVRAAVEDHLAAAEASRHTLRFEAANDELVVETDAARVRQVLDNLLSNAIKYTPAPGAITVSLLGACDDDVRVPDPHVDIRVTDSGPGIAPELRHGIFDEFTRLEKDSTIQGHGLGLAIARRVARLLGGDLFVADVPTRGATFVLRLPCSDRQAVRDRREPAGSRPPGEQSAV